jgi:outer membrane protein assembly factor BamB
LRKQEFVWERDWFTEANLDYLPYLAGDVLLGRSFALDSRTGRKLWQLTEEDALVSNISASNGVAYYFTKDGQLRAVNARTGEVLASLQLEVETLLKETDLRSSYPFNVVARGNKVVVYLGDAYQLYVFQFVPR